MDPLHIYFDEFGHFSPNQHKEGTYSHFVYCALIFQTDQDKTLFEDKAKEIIKKDFAGNFFKSNKLQHKTRMRVLEKLLDLRWRISVFVVDQKKLEGALSEFQRSFLKYFQRIFLKGLTENVNKFHIQFDKLGSEEFQRSLKDYMDQHVTKWDLFNQIRSYQMFDEKRDKNYLLAFADFFANSVGQYYCKSHYREESGAFLDRIVNRVQVTHFPYKAIYDNKLIRRSSDFDSLTANISLQIANDKLQELYEKEEKLEYQALLECLILNYKLNPNRLLSLSELTDHLLHYYPGINEDRTRTIISDLRTMGVLIISSKGRAGYKLPNTIADFDMFFKRYLDSVVPMLKRIDQSHNIVYNKSNNVIDLLNTVSNQDILKALLSVVKGA